MSKYHYNRRKKGKNAQFFLKADSKLRKTLFFYSLPFLNIFVWGFSHEGSEI